MGDHDDFKERRPDGDNALDMTGKGLLRECEELLARLGDGARREDGENDLVAIDRLLSDLDRTHLSPVMVCDLLAAKARALARAERLDDAFAALDEIIGRFGHDHALDVTHRVAYAVMLQAAFLIDSDQLDAAEETVDELVRRFNAAPDDQNLTGFGFMLLDTAFRLLGHELPRPILRICEPVIARLINDTDARRAVAAGAIFYQIQALSRLDQLDATPVLAESLVDIGEPALAALDRISEQFGAEHRNPAWHLQIGAMRMNVLLGLGRTEDARAQARRLYRRARTYGLPREFTDAVRELENEIAEQS